MLIWRWLFHEQGQYRKPQTKKHKTWDGDGVLVVQGRLAKLHNGDNGQESVATIRLDVVLAVSLPIARTWQDLLEPD